MKKLFYAAVCALCLSVPAFASGSFECDYDPAFIQQLILSVYDPSGAWNIVSQDANALTLSREVEPSSIRYLMPMVKLPKRNPRDPKEPDRWDHAPVHYAEEYATFSFRVDTRSGRVRTTARHDVVANPGRRGEYTVKSDDSNFMRLVRYCATFLDGGWGGGFETGWRNNHMYITDVFDGSAAAAAGVQPDDRVRLINKTVADEVSLDQFARKYQWAELGKPFTMDLERPNGERYHVELAVDYIPAQTERAKRFFRLDEASPGVAREQVYASAPRYTPPVTEEMKRAQAAQKLIGLTFDDSGKVTAVAKDSLAAKAGLAVGDLITEHNLVSLKSAGAAKTRADIERRVTGGLVSMLTVRRGSKELIIKIKK